MNEIPVRFPPPLSGGKFHDALNIHPECCQLARLNGQLVVCIRTKDHPVAINFGHSNGYDEWCFDTDKDGNAVGASGVTE